tara:strand:- start:378 stop:740 length:363 start_codon:yes stop_codon:yes gene_type:complete
MGSLDDATSDNTSQETTLATIRSVSGDWDNAAVRSEMHAASGDWDNASVNVSVTSVSGISAIANTNSSEGQGSYTYDGGQATLNKQVLQGNYFGQTISYSEGTLTLARETYVFTVCDCDG